jgi:hypothetical protein
MNMGKNFRGDGLLKVPEDNLISRNPVVVGGIWGCFGRSIGVFVGGLNLQELRRRGIRAVEQPDEPGATDWRENLGTPARVIGPRQLVRRRVAEGDRRRC